MSIKSYLREESWAIGINRSSLRAMGAWSDTDEKKFLKDIRIPSMAIMIFVFIIIPQAFALPLHLDNFILALDNVMSSFPALISCVKLVIFWNNEGALRLVLNALSQDWKREKENWELEAMRRAAFQGRTFTVIGYSLVSTSFASFFIFPLYGLNIRLFSNITDIGKYPLVVQSYYPFDFTKSPIFELLHLSQIIGCVMIACAMSIPDHYFGILVFHVSGQFEILGVKMEHLIGQNDDENFKSKLRICVKRHVQLINIVNVVQKSFSSVIFCQVFCLCILACCVGFRILRAFQHPSEGMGFFQILTLFGGLFFVLCFTLNDCAASEALAFHSSKLFSNLYNCKWYDSPDLPVRDLTVVFCATKKPQMLSAGKLIRLSLLSYCSILKSIGGYISVLFAVSSR